MLCSIRFRRLKINDLFSEAISGNLSFLNHLTVLPALACLDDACWRWLPGSRCVPRERRATALRALVDMALLAIVAYLSWPVAKNLLQLDGRQQMNASFGAFRLVNTYGAFGNVGEERYAARRRPMAPHVAPLLKKLLSCPAPLCSAAEPPLA